MRRSLNRLTLLLLGLLVIPISLSGQTEYGNITGVVADPTGGVIPGAEVLVTNTATNVKKTTITTAGGEYNVPVPPGTYQVQVTLTGFKRHVSDNVVVAAATTLRLEAGPP